MTTGIELSNRFREVLLNGKWIANTNYKDVLSNINWKQADKKVGSLNTIAALTQHINYYISGILKVFEGENLEIRDNYSFDFQVIQSEDEWQEIQKELFSNAEKFASHIDEMPSLQLEKNFVDEKYGTYQRNIDAMIEHSYYHLGQISLIKKML